MLNRLIRVIVVLLCALLTIPSLILTPITYILFNFPLIELVAVLGMNAMQQDDWNYKTMFQAIQ